MEFTNESLAAKVPPQVKAQAELANKLLKEQSGNPDNPESASGDPAKADKPKAESLNDANLQPDPPPVKPSPEEDQSLEYWKNRFSVLQGKYNTEIQTLKDDPKLLQNLKEQNRQYSQLITEFTQAKAQLAQQVSNLTARLEQQAKTVPPKESSGEESEGLPNVKKLLSDDQMEFLREEGLDNDKFYGILQVLSGASSQPKAASEPKPAVEPKQAPVQQIVTPEEKAFWVTMKGSAPDYEEINKDQKFIDWLLATVVPYQNGKVMNDLIIEAQTNLDAQTAAGIFNDFVSKTGWKKGASPDVPKPPIEPDSTVTNPPAETPQGRIIPLSEFNAFYNTIGRLINQQGGVKTDEQIKKDAEYIKAANEGRIDRTK